MAYSEEVSEEKRNGNSIKTINTESAVILT
jgi:hypothetical protein